MAVAGSSQRIYPYKQNDRFCNYPGEKQEGMLRSSFSLLESLLQKTRGLRRLKQQWNSSSDLFQPAIHRTSTDPRITWVGHSTFIINVGGLNIITDPIFGNPSFLFPRMMPPGVTLEQVPRIDVVLISHNHRDHMHAPTLYALHEKNSNIKILVPLGDKAWFDKRGFKDVQEYTWWDGDTVTSTAGCAVSFTFLPAVHWSGRGLFDKNKSLWGSWMISSLASAGGPAVAHNLYFAGDTAYGRHFKAIATEFGRIDTVLMPIGPCEPHEDLHITHVNAEQAGQAFLDLGADRFIPMHWGVFWFGTDYPLMPIERLQAWWKKQEADVATKTLNPLKFGESIECKRVFEVQPTVSLHKVRDLEMF